MDLTYVIEKVKKQWTEEFLRKDEKEVIERFGKVFHPTNLDKLKEEDFREFFSFKHNRHWRGIERTSGLAKDLPKLKNTLKILLDESIPIRDRIKKIRDKTSNDYHDHFGFSSYTPILLVVYPTKYGVINAISKEGLKRTELYTDFDEKEEWIVYDEANNIMVDFAKRNNLSLWQLDWVWGTLIKTYDFKELKEYIEKEINKRANYQHVMLKTILDLDGATKEEINKQILKYNPQKEQNFVSKEVYDTLVDEYHYVLEQDDEFILNLVEPLTNSQREELISLCDNFINKFNIKNDTQYFLVQVGDFGSDTIVKKGYYQHEGWQETPRDAAHGEVKVGDLLLVYFTGKAIDYQKTLKMIYEVKSITKNNVRFNLEPKTELKGLSLDTVRNLVQNKQLGEIFNKISQQGFNIAKISKSDFETVLKIDGNTLDVIVNEEQFQIGHKMFEKEMFDKSQIQFTDFNHPHLIKNEISYKKEILEKTKHIRSENNLKQWITSKGTLLEKLKEVCSQSISKNLLMGAKYGIEESSAASLHIIPENIKSEYEQVLFDFITFANKSKDEFGIKFDKLIEFLSKNNLKTDWRFLAYMSFISNPEKYFPIQPTLFEKLLQFYGNQYKIRANYSWKLYSAILQLAELLKLKLAKYGALDAIQIQSYMWVIANLLDSNKINLEDHVNYWMIRPGSGGEDWENQLSLGLIGIAFYDKIGELSKFIDSNGNIDEQKLRQSVIENEDRPGAQARNFGQLRQFMRIKKGDQIIAEGKGTILGIGRVNGKYQYKPNLPLYHTIPVDWYNLQISGTPTNKLWLGTIISLSKEEFEQLVSGTISIPSEFEEYSNILLKKAQMVFYGPPGTGKTFVASKFANWFTSSNNVTTNKEDLQQMNDDQFNDYVINELQKFSERQNYEFIKDQGTINQFILRSSHNEIRIVFAFSKSGKQDPDSVYLGISEKMISFLNQVPIENQFIVIINNDVKNFVVLPYLVEQKYARFVAGQESGKWDSTGKGQHAFRLTISKDSAKMPTRENTYSDKYLDCAEYLGSFDVLGIGDYQEVPDFVRRVTFHPSYSYEEFVEGIKPRTRGEYVEYVLEDGAFKKACNDARSDPENRYVLVIDEINRGNTSKIFGELITLIETDKRNSYNLILTYSKKPFSVPSNLYIIGTMNTADRSLTQLDVALRRRFAFCELLPKSSLLNKTIEGIHVGKMLDSINKKLREEGLREKQIGHSYFMRKNQCIDTIEDLQFVFTNEIIPLFQEYFYEDYESISRLLGPEFIDAKEMKVNEEWKTNKDVFIDALRRFQ